MSLRGTVERELDVLRSYLGYQEEPGNRTKFGKFRHQDGEAWCGNFVAGTMAEAGVPGWDDVNPLGVGYTPTMAAYGKSLGTWWSDPAKAKPGDVVLYQWPTMPPGRYGHTGVVEAVEFDSHGKFSALIAIEGNTNPGGASRTGGGVYRVRRKVYIAGGFTPRYLPSSPPPTPQPQELTMGDINAILEALKPIQLLLAELVQSEGTAIVWGTDPTTKQPRNFFLLGGKVTEFPDTAVFEELKSKMNLQSTEYTWPAIEFLLEVSKGS